MGRDGALGGDCGDNNISICAIWADSHAVECRSECICDVAGFMCFTRGNGDDLCGNFATYVEKWSGFLSVICTGDGRVKKY